MILLNELHCILQTIGGSPVESRVLFLSPQSDHRLRKWGEPEYHLDLSSHSRPVHWRRKSAGG